MSGTYELAFTKNKNCFCQISSRTPLLNSHKLSKDVICLSIKGKDTIHFISATQINANAGQSKDKIYLNGLYAHRLGLKETDSIYVEVVDDVVACSRASVEPVSIDDWEILELNAEYIQSNILDQIRIVSPGVILPLWVSGNICIFVQIGSVEPAGSDCVRLDQHTELIVSPKDRRSRPTQPAASALPLTGSHVADNKDRETGMVPDTSKQLIKNESSVANRLPENSSNITTQAAADDDGSLFSLLYKRWWGGGCNSQNNTDVSTDQPSVEDTQRHWKKTKLDTPIITRVQSSYLDGYEAWWSKYPNMCVIHRSLCSAYDQTPQPFIAQLTLLLSPLEIEIETKKNAAKIRKRNTKQAPVKTERLIGTVCIIVADQTTTPIRSRHVLLDDKFMRLHRLTSTSRVRLDTVKQKPSQLNSIQIQPLHPLPDFMNKDLILTALRAYIDMTTANHQYPLVLQTSTTMSMRVTAESKAEFLLLGQEKNTTESQPANQDDSGDITPPYYLVSSNELSDIKLHCEETVTERCNSDIRPPYMIQDSILADKPRGCDDVINKCLDFAHASIQCRTEGGLLLTGARGSGKTTLVTCLLKQMSKDKWCYTHKIDSKMLRGKRPDMMKKLFDTALEECIWREPSVLFIDNLDNLCKAPSGPEEEASPEILYSAKISEVLKDCLSSMWTSRPAVAVVCTSKSRTSLHSKLTPTHGNHVFHATEEIPPLNQRTRLQVLKAVIEDMDISCNIPERDLLSLSDKLEGYVARDLTALVRRAAHAHTIVTKENPPSCLLSEDFTAALHGFTPASLRGVALHTPGDSTWRDVGGLNNVKSQLIRMLEWPTKYRQLYAQCPIRLQSGVLLYGAPGTGKTLIASVIAKEMGLNFISIKGPELLNKYIGASEQAVRDTFRKAQSVAPCILFFDEFESLAPRRGHDSTGVTDRVVNQLLTQLDGVEALEGVYVMAATSRPDLIDPALLRPGRLDKSLCCEVPTIEDRVEILQALAHHMNLADEVNLADIASKCEYCTGADLKSLLVNSQLEAVHDIMNNQIYNAGSVTCPPSVGVESSQGIMGMYKSSMEEEPKSITPQSPCYNKVQRLYSMQSSQSTPQNRQDSSQATPGHMITIQQHHLDEALNNLQPSVSESERRRYQMIYEQFNQSKTEAAQVRPDKLLMTKQRATLA